MISIDTKVNLAFLLSLASTASSIYLYRMNKKFERIRVYEKIYQTCQWLLLHEYNQLKKMPYECDNEDLQKAVRQHLDAHSDLQFWGGSFDMPAAMDSETKRRIFRKLVEDEAWKYEKEIWKQVGEHHQSPVFLIDSEEAIEKLGFVLNYVGENLSYFSGKVQDNWHETQTTSIEDVLKDYKGREKLIEIHGEEAETDFLKDPFVKILIDIRKEYKDMTMTLPDKLFWPRLKIEIWFSKIKRKLLFHA